MVALNFSCELFDTIYLTLPWTFPGVLGTLYPSLFLIYEELTPYSDICCAVIVNSETSSQGQVLAEVSS